MSVPANGRIRTPAPRRRFLAGVVCLALSLEIYAASGLAANSAVRWPPWLLIVPRWLDHVVAPFGTDGPVRTIVSVALLLAAVYFFRGATAHHRAARPSAVEVRPFTDVRATIPSAGAAEGGSGLGERPALESASAAQLTAGNVFDHFRVTLDGLRLPSSPSAVPSVAGEQRGFLEEIKTATETSKSPLGLVVAGMRALVRIEDPYRVSGAIRVRIDAPSCGLTIQVSAAHLGSSAAATLWDADWPLVAERAADFVAAFILPRTVLCRRPPWSSWRGREIPPSLVRHHRLARRSVGSRRFEEGLAFYYLFLHGDPFNPYVRIDAALVLEQLSQHLEAVSIYADVIATQRWIDWRLRRRLSRRHATGASHHPLPRRETGDRRALREALLVARYRLACRLVAADSPLADSWHRAGGDQRAAITDRTKELLASYYEEFCRTYKGYGFPRGIDEFLDQSAVITRFFLRYVGEQEARLLVQDFAWWRLRRRPGMVVTQTSLRILPIWAPLYLHHARSWVDRSWNPFCSGPAPACERTRSVSTLPWPPRHPRGKVWPPNAHLLQRRLDEELSRKLRRFRQWQEYYNAACTVAVTLLPVPDSEQHDTDNRRHLEGAAASYLELAIGLLHSGDAARQGEYIEYADPDLAELRKTTAFSVFVDRYFPRTDPARQGHPENDLSLLLPLHAIRLLRGFARLHVELAEAGLRPRTDESDAVELCRQVAVRHTDWTRRHRLITSALELSRTYRNSSFDPTFPTPADDLVLVRLGKEGDRGPNSLDDLRGEFRECLKTVADTLGESTDESGRNTARDIWSAVERKISTALDTAAGDAHGTG